VYRLRWEVETFFKTAKSGCGLNELPSKQQHVVETLVYAALFRATLSMTTRRQMLAASFGRAPCRINPTQWVRWWNQELFGILRRVVDVVSHVDDALLFALLEDPNRKRVPTRYRFSAELVFGEV
jgi:hypothetical protein